MERGRHWGEPTHPAPKNNVPFRHYLRNLGSTTDIFVFKIISEAPPTYGAVVSGASMSYPTPQSQHDNQGAYPTFYGSGLHAEYNSQGQSDQSTEYYMATQTQDGNQANCPGTRDRTQSQSTDPGVTFPGDVRNTTSQPHLVELSSGDVHCEIFNPGC